ncbi:MAG TPA: DUF1778 domain-containing protein [Planctomycetaceae bacterium]|jgi:uncharacterized protein (DUF1778 family)
MANSKDTVRLSFRLSVEQKRTIEEAAAELGQSVSDFAVGILARAARKVLQERNATILTRRDYEEFLRILGDDSAKPNKALSDAARKYILKIV